MLTATLFLKAANWKQPGLVVLKCLGMNKPHHEMGRSSAAGRHRLAIQATTQVNLPTSVLCEGSQMWKDPAGLTHEEGVSQWIIHRISVSGTERTPPRKRQKNLTERWIKSLNSQLTKEETKWQRNR